MMKRIRFKLIKILFYKSFSMPFLIDIKEELDEQIQAQIRKFRHGSAATGYKGWYRIQVAIAKARDCTIYHDNIENFIMPNLFDEKGDAISWYHWRDPQQVQVNMIKNNLKIASNSKRLRGRVTKTKLKKLMKEILEYRIKNYLNPKKDMDKLKIMCIVGGSGSGKTLASLHLKNFKDANVICSFTTRPPRPTEVEGRDHHFIDIVPDRTELIAYTHFGGHYYYATKWQVSGPCTVYVIDEKGLENLRRDYGDVYDIYSVLIKRDKSLRRKVGVDSTRIRRDERRKLYDKDYDYVVVNNGSKREFFEKIEGIYDEIKAN